MIGTFSHTSLPPIVRVSRSVDAPLVPSARTAQKAPTYSVRLIRPIETDQETVVLPEAKETIQLVKGRQVKPRNRK